MRWFVRCGPLTRTEMRDQWNIKLFIGFSFFQTSGPLLPIPLLDHSMLRLGKGQAIWKSEWILCLYIHSLNIILSNFRSISAITTIWSFNGQIRQRTSNTWRPEWWWYSSQDLLNDLFQQELHHIITGPRTLSSKTIVCGNSHPRHNLRVHHRR